MEKGKIYAQDIIEIVIPANNTSLKINIPDQPNLRSVQLVGIQIFDASTQTKSVLSGNTLVSKADLTKIAITLCDFKGFEFLKYAPALQFRTIDSVAAANGENLGNIERNAHPFNGQIVNYPKSYINLTETLGNVNPLSVYIAISYYTKDMTSATSYSNKR